MPDRAEKFRADTQYWLLVLIVVLNSQNTQFVYWNTVINYSTFDWKMLLKASTRSLLVRCVATKHSFLHCIPLLALSTAAIVCCVLQHFLSGHIAMVVVLECTGRGWGVIADESFNLIKSSRGSVGTETELMILHLSC